ncbi:MAG TPA: hypothetical protein VIL92_06360 [Gaiellaceae bacterium]|jgi:hypothetical protein
MGYDHYDEFHPAYARNTERLLKGRVLQIGDNERGIEERTICIDRLKGVGVGVDRDGLFSFVQIVTTDGETFTLLDNGQVEDAEERTVSYDHGIRNLPAQAVV